MKILNKEIQTLERLILNAIPSKQTILVDDWIVRLNEGFTYRANCVCPFQYFENARNKLNLKYCEKIFELNNLPTVVKYTPTMQHGFDQILQQMGYKLVKAVNAMVCPILEYEVPEYIVMMDSLDEEWLEAATRVSGVMESFSRIYRTGIENIALTRKFVCAVMEGRIVGCGYGVVEKSYVGIYDLHVLESYRRQGIGKSICNAILKFGKEQGATKGYLIVHSKNSNAITLYKNNGFRKLYEYQFYQKDKPGAVIIDS